MLTVLLTLSLSLYSIHSSEHFCPASGCQHSVIRCNPNEDCSIYCTGKESCIESTIHCPNHGSCELICRGGKACFQTVINGTSSTGNINVECSDSTDQCNGMQLYGSTLDTNSNLNLHCNGNIRSCATASVVCPVTGQCNVLCFGDSSCRWMNIMGPSNGELLTSCRGSKSCLDAIFDGSFSSSLRVQGCVDFESCHDLTLKCPPNRNGTKMCSIEGR